MRGNEAYKQQINEATYPLGGSSIMVCGCLFYYCKFQVITLPKTTDAQRYQQEKLNTAVVSHFDNNLFLNRLMFMDDWPDDTDLMSPSLTCELKLSMHHYSLQGSLILTPSNIMGSISVQAKGHPVYNLSELTYTLYDK